MAKNMEWLDMTAMVLLIVGGLNWGLGIWDINLVTMLFGVGSVMTNIVYALVGLSGIYKLFSLFK